MCSYKGTETFSEFFVGSVVQVKNLKKIVYEECRTAETKVMKLFFIRTDFGETRKFRRTFQKKCKIFLPLEIKLHCFSAKKFE